MASPPMQQEYSAVLRLRGLPYSATDADVVAFFDGWAPIDVVLLSRAGRASGEALVRFGSVEQAAAARQVKHCAHLGGRYIEVFPSTEDDLAAALKGDAGGPAELGGQPMQRQWVLRLRGLPFSAGPEQVLDFFGPEHHIIGGTQGVVLTRDQDGRPTGEAFVEVPSEAAQQSALTLHRAQMGPRYIEIFVASKPDMQQAMQRNRQVARLGDAGSRRRQPLLPLPLPSAPGGVQPDGATLKLRGLPYSAGVDDITNWLMDFKLADDGVKLMTKAGSSGERVNTGIAFVRFNDADEAALAAAAQHRKMMGTRYIECIPYTAPPRQQGVRHPRPPLMGGPALYPAPVTMQLPSPLPYGMPVGPRPPYPPRGGGQDAGYGRGRGPGGGRGGAPRMGLPPALAAQQAYQQHAYGQQQPFLQQQGYGGQPQPQGRPPPSPTGRAQLPPGHQQQQFFMQQQLLQQQQQQLAMRGMQSDWSPQLGGVPMLVAAQPPVGARGAPGMQWYMPPSGSDAGMPAGVAMPAMAGSPYGAVPSTYPFGGPTSPYPVAMPGYGVPQHMQQPLPPAAQPIGGQPEGEPLQQPASPGAEGLPQTLPGDEAHRASLDAGRPALQDTHRTSLDFGRAASQGTHQGSLDVASPTPAEQEGQQ